MKKTIAIVGAGRAGQTLARALRLKGYRVACVVTRSLKTAQKARQFIGGGTPVRAPLKAVPDANVVLISAPDDRTGAVADSLARAEGNWRGKVVLHTSGALSSRVLEPLRRRGASVGSMHPIFAFPQPLKKFPAAGVVFGIEGSPAALKEAQRLVRALRGVAVKVRADRKALYHASAALVAGHLMTLVDLGVRMMTRSGVPAKRARGALLPLVFGTVGNYSRRGAEAWTGPLERGDAETVREHVKALRRLPRRYREAYVTLGLAAVELYKPKGKAGTAALKRALRGGRSK